MLKGVFVSGKDYQPFPDNLTGAGKPNIINTTRQSLTTDTQYDILAMGV